MNTRRSVAEGESRQWLLFLDRFARLQPGYGEHVPWTDFFKSAARRKFVARLALHAAGNQLVARRIVLDSLPSHRRVGRPLSRYPDLAFVEVDVSGATVARWLTKSKGQAAGVSFEIPPSQNQGNLERYQSHSTTPGLALQWPLIRYQLPASAAYPGRPDTHITMRQGLPSFSTYQAALAYYLYPGEDFSTLNSVPDALVVVRVADTRCWIQHMHFSPGHVDLRLRGTESQLSSVELIGAPRTSKRVGRTRRVRMPVPIPPDDTQILVVKGDAWLDHRSLGRTLQFEGRPDVTFEPPDWSVRLAVLATNGESNEVEYKRQLPATDGERSKLARTVIAFANSGGGCILYGVAEEGPSETRILGVDRSTTSVADRLTSIIHDQVTPFPTGTQIIGALVDGSQLWAVIVPKQKKPLFALNGDPPRFYVRRNANTYQANLEDIRELAATLAGAASTAGTYRRW